MKRILLAAALLLATAAQAATPPCWPKQLGSTGSSFKTGSTPDGRWVAWVCVVKGEQKTFGVWAVTGFDVVHPDTTGLTPIKSAVAYWNANVSTTDTPALIRLRAAAHEAFKP